jgi:hypothetical protein
MKHELGVGEYSRVLPYDDTNRYRGKTYPFVISRLEPIDEVLLEFREYA